MMDEDESYQGAMTGEEAEKQLKMSGIHCYLVRYSEKRKSYILSVYKEKPYTMKHFKIIVNDDIYKIEGKSMEFNGIEALRTYYENNRIDPALSNIGKRINLLDSAVETLDNMEMN